MYYLPRGPGSWYNLPNHLGVAYAAQEHWVFNATVKVSVSFVALACILILCKKKNIIFQDAYEPERYNAGTSKGREK